MSKRAQVLSAVPWLFVAVAASATMEPNCPLPDPAWNLTQIARWAEGTDNVVGQLLPVRPGDLQTEFGTIIDRGCLENLSQPDRDKRISEIKRTVAYTLTQLQRCYRVTQVETLPGILTRLRRTRIKCNPPSIAGADLETGLVSWDGAVTGIDQPAEVEGWTSSFEKMNVPQRAGLLAHELMHLGPCNNRHWHGQVPAGGYGTGCDNKSIFLDRVYLMQHACFPGEGTGQLYSNPGIDTCPQVCERAFTEVDEGTISGFQNFLSGGQARRVGLARRYSQQEARLVCDRITGQARLFKLRDQENAQNTADANSAIDFVSTAPTTRLPALEAKPIVDLLTKLRAYAPDAYRPNLNLTESVRYVEGLRTQLAAEITRLCNDPSKSHQARSFCLISANGGGPVMSKVDAILARLRAIGPGDMILRMPPPKT